jgi:NitT/TauT family transport system ATP-binding protein
MIEVRDIAKVYQSGTRKTHAIGSAGFSVKRGEFVSIVGPSGCGKSTLLNMVASFMAPTSGQILVDGKPVAPGQIPPKLGYIFQKDTVLPWFTVARNVGLGLRFRGVPEPEIAAKVERLLGMAHLTGCGDMFPHHLSGGMRQRVALLMTLACDPEILLLDEPFGALDSNTKMVLHNELLDIWQQLGQTILMVTHDLDEAVTLSDRVIVLSAPPSRVVLDHRVNLPRPRDVFSLRQSPEFGENVREIWRVLGREFKQAGREAVEHAA